MKKTTQGFLAGAAGLGLLLGGSTFALWSDSDSANNSQITSGNLEVKVNDANWRDISDDHTAQGHEIKDLTEFKIIPGDKIQGEFGVAVALEGENMVAELKLANAGELGAEGPLARGLEVDYEIQDHVGTSIGHGKTDGVKVQLASPDNGNNQGWHRLPTVNATPDGKAEFTVVVTVKFKDTDDLTLRKSRAGLLNAELELKQVREGAPGFKSAPRPPR